MSSTSSAVSTGRTPPLPCPLGDLVPHAPPMLVEGYLLQVAAGRGQDLSCAAEARAPLVGPLVDRNLVMPEYCIELLAQSVAAGRSYRARDGDLPAGGMLAAVDHFSWHGYPAPGEQLRVMVQSELSFGPVLVVTGRVSREEEILAAGRLKIWSRSDPPALPRRMTADSAPIASTSLPEALRTQALQANSREAGGGKMTGSFHFSADFPGFQGHFPGNPILPAIAQCAAVRILAEQVLTMQLLPLGFEALKWTRPILPGETVSITADLAQGGPQLSLSFAISSDTGRIAAGTAHFLRAS